MKRMNATHSGGRGYTVVEVLSAMTLFAIGAAGVISMQRVTIQGGDDARRMDVATSLAHEWTARLQRDSMFWTKPNSSDPSINLNETQWLVDCPTGTWKKPATTGPGKTGSFDLFGQDRPASSGDHIFCAQYRLKWITPPGTAAPYRVGASMLAEVRVFWARLDNPIVGDCTATSLAVDPDGATGPNYYHFVYAATAIRPNPWNYDAGTP